MSGSDKQMSLAGSLITIPQPVPVEMYVLACVTTSEMLPSRTGAANAGAVHATSSVRAARTEFHPASLPISRQCEKGDGRAAMRGQECRELIGMAPLRLLGS